MEAVVLPAFACVNWEDSAVACVRNIVFCCGDDVISSANWQLLSPGVLVNTPGLEFDDDLLATSNGKRLVLRDFFCLQLVRSPTELLTAASRAIFNTKMRAKTRGETAAAGAVLPFCVLSGPTQLTFVNKRKSSSFQKELPPPMFHRFRDLGFGFFADIVREYSGAAAEAAGDDVSSSAVPRALPPLDSSATGVLTSIRRVLQLPILMLVD